MSLATGTGIDDDGVDTDATGAPTEGKGADTTSGTRGLKLGMGPILLGAEWKGPLEAPATEGITSSVLLTGTAGVSALPV